MKTVMVVQQHACGQGCGCGGPRSHPGPTGRLDARTAELVKAAVTKAVAKAMAPLVVQQRTPTLVEQVQAELRKSGNQRVIAAVDEERGIVVQTFLAPQPYYATARHDDPSALRTRVTELEVELRQLEARRAPKSERTRVQVQLDTARRELERAEAARRYERRRQQIGDMPPLRESA